MITLRFYKKDALRYVSHIDLLRLITRTLRRSGIIVKLSEGFNPHMLINLSVPLPVGINSSSEYVTVDTDCDASSFLELYNRFAVKGLEGIKAFEVKKNPNLAGKVVAADYYVCHKNAYKFKREIENIINQKEYIINYPTKTDSQATKNIASNLFGIKVYENTINFCVAAGNTTLRADRFAKHLMSRFDIQLDMSSIWRYNKYVREMQLIDVESYLLKQNT